jgi:hypothetical protein
VVWVFGRKPSFSAIVLANGLAQKVALFKTSLLKSGRVLRFLNWHETDTFGWREPPPIGCGFPDFFDGILTLNCL